MPHEDDPDGEGLSEVLFTELSEDDEGEGDDTLFGLSKGLRCLDIGGPAAQRRIGIKVSSTSVRRFSREDKPTHMIDNPLECAPAPRGWSRAFPSRI